MPFPVRPQPLLSCNQWTLPVGDLHSSQHAPTMSATFGKSDLLSYDAQHRVIICRECKYAIQKSALDSHLLRHKIYRGERQRLLASIHQCDILEPDDVQLPPPEYAPVDGLPVLPGYRCTATGCGVLCASSKRMRRHWSEIHGIAHPPDTCARSATIQTFFRGTKLRYFEVGLVPDLTTPGTAVEHTAPQLSPVDAPLPIPPVFAPPVGAAGSNGLDLDILRYFHHFLTTTCLTLPPMAEPAKHWQVDAVAQALRLDWLMCGLLAISACHLVSLSEDEPIKISHHVQSETLSQSFFIGLAKKDEAPGTTAVEDVALAAQMSCIIRCFGWTPNQPSSDPTVRPEPLLSRIREFASTLQGCFDSKSELLPSAVPGNTGTDTALSRSNVPVTMVVPDAVSSGTAPPSLLKHFRTLPFRMAAVTDKPESALDFFATLSALEAVSDCCRSSYAADDMDSTGNAMVSWLSNMSEHFASMLWSGNTAALVVLAQWTLLVERAEHHCWFLRGSAATTLDMIEAELPQDDSIRSLVRPDIIDRENTSPSVRSDASADLEPENPIAQAHEPSVTVLVFQDCAADNSTWGEDKCLTDPKVDNHGEQFHHRVRVFDAYGADVEALLLLPGKCLLLQT
ncbi:hypothetical protein GE09DRAFT_1066425 [Coniochaeta sp. 2T2.1]|nr:hypothetical protein GE09DRAFT_1066425 [Coniochaeta sp. 2T2.1]